MKTVTERNLIFLLRQTKEVLEKYGIIFWLDCGTLLGAVRDGTFIPWEHDIDYGAWSSAVSYKKRLSIARNLSKQGFKVYIGDSQGYNHMNIRMNSAQVAILADINFYTIKNDKAIVPLRRPKKLMGRLLYLSYDSLNAPYHFNINDWKITKRFFQNLFLLISRLLPSPLRKSISSFIYLLLKKIDSENVSWIVPIQLLANFSTIDFYGMKFNVPSKPEKFLAYRYGNNWMIPKRNYNKDINDYGRYDVRLRLSETKIK